MAQQIELQRSQSGYDNEGLQQLQRELNEEHQNLQRMTSAETREDRQKMREIFESVRIVVDIRNLHNVEKLIMILNKYFCFFSSVGHK